MLQGLHIEIARAETSEGKEGEARAAIKPLKCKFCDWELAPHAWTAMQDPTGSLRSHVKVAHPLVYAPMAQYLTDLHTQERLPPEVRMAKATTWG